MNRCTSCNPRTSIIGGEGPPKLTAAQLENPSIGRALNDNAIGGLFLGAGAAVLAFSYPRGGLAGNPVAIFALASTLLGVGILGMSRRSADKA